MTAIKRLPESLQPVANWILQFNELTLRERAIVSIAVLGLLWGAWFVLVNEHYVFATATAERSAQMTTAQISANQVRKKELIQQVSIDPNEHVRENIKSVRAELTTIELDLKSSLSQFIPPHAMTLVLKDVMADHKKLTLTQLDRLPARELLPDEEDINLFLHPMRIVVEGSYLDVLDYVHSLEKGDWQFNWKRFDYETKGYPKGIATIEIETLSRNEHWLGL